MYLSDSVKETQVLESIFDIEELLSSIKDDEEEIEHLKNLKGWRNKKIDERISSTKESVELAKRIILNTMVRLEPKKKTIPFPGVGKVTRKAKAANWQVEDDEKLLSDLDSRGLKDKVIEKKEVLVKKSLNALLDDIEKSGKELPAGIKKIEPSESLSISFEETEEKKEEVPVVARAVDLEKLESLEL